MAPPHPLHMLAPLEVELATSLFRQALVASGQAEAGAVLRWVEVAVEEPASPAERAALMADSDAADLRSFRRARLTVYDVSSNATCGSPTPCPSLPLSPSSLPRWPCRLHSHPRRFPKCFVLCGPWFPSGRAGISARRLHGASARLSLCFHLSPMQWLLSGEGFSPVCAANG